MQDAFIYISDKRQPIALSQESIPTSSKLNNGDQIYDQLFCPHCIGYVVPVGFTHIFFSNIVNVMSNRNQSSVKPSKTFLLQVKSLNNMLRSIRSRRCRYQGFFTRNIKTFHIEREDITASVLLCFQKIELNGTTVLLVILLFKILPNINKLPRSSAMTNIIAFFLMQIYCNGLNGLDGWNQQLLVLNSYIFFELNHI